jgi:hypothetical protein
MQLQLSIGTLACHAGLAADGLGRAAQSSVLGQNLKGLVTRQRSATVGAFQ